MRFHATIEQSGRTATGIRAPEEVVAALGSDQVAPPGCQQPSSPES
jgi:hypothetical protein